VNTPIRLVGAVVLVVAGYALFRFVIFPPSAHLSAEQRASLQTLKPRLPELVISQADASIVAGDVRDCVGESPAPRPAVDPAMGKRRRQCLVRTVGRIPHVHRRLARE